MDTTILAAAASAYARQPLLADSLAVEAAAAAISADMAAFTDWLHSACANASQVSSERITRIPAMLTSRLSAADTPQVLHLWLTGDDGDALEARRELTQRYARECAPLVDRAIARELERLNG